MQNTQFDTKISNIFYRSSTKICKKENITILVKTYEDFIKTYNDNYKIGETLSADIIIKPYTTGYNNFISFSIYDIDISPLYQSKNIIKKNISYG